MHHARTAEGVFTFTVVDRHGACPDLVRPSDDSAFDVVLWRGWPLIASHPVPEITTFADICFNDTHGEYPNGSRN
jgi:hypothetical protein